MTLGGATIALGTVMLSSRRRAMGAGNSCRNQPAPKDRAQATARPGLRPDKLD